MIKKKKTLAKRRKKRKNKNLPRTFKFFESLRTLRLMKICLWFALTFNEIEMPARLQLILTSIIVKSKKANLFFYRDSTFSLIFFNFQ